MARETLDGPALSALVIAAMRLAGVVVDEETLARVLPLAEAVLADGSLLSRAAGSTLEPLAHPEAPGAGA